jgi:hypothetical protein
MPKADISSILSGETDARVWAQQWVLTAKEILAREEGRSVALLDEGAMTGWFANAIETGRDAGWRAHKPPREEPEPPPVVTDAMVEAFTDAMSIIDMSVPEGSPAEEAMMVAATRAGILAALLAAPKSNGHGWSPLPLHTDES